MPQDLGRSRGACRAVNEAYEIHRARCNRLGRYALLLGLGAAVLIYLLAGEGPQGAQGSRFDDGGAQQALSEVSKSYLRNMEYYGGKANVMAYELRLWIDGLFQGKNLAFTVGAVSLAVALCFFILARLVPPQSAPKPDAPKPPRPLD